MRDSTVCIRYNEKGIKNYLKKEIISNLRLKNKLEKYTLLRDKTKIKI